MLRTIAPAFAILSLAASSATYAQPTANSLRFEVTDVQVVGYGPNPYTYMSGGMLRGERYDLRKATMLDMIRLAYGVDADKVAGGPSWLDLDRFSVAGKAPASTPPPVVNQMLQALLADRFKLMVHIDTRPLPAFELTTAGKSKFKESGAIGQSGCKNQQPPGAAPFTMSCRNVTMAALAENLRQFAGDYLPYPVTDATGLKGSFDIDLKWNRRSQILPVGAPRQTVFAAVEDQLGLKLELSKSPAPVVVVDRVNEKPTENAPGVEQALPARPLRFEVADIRPSTDDETGNYKLYPNGRLDWRAMPMKILISTAWDVDWDHIDDVLAGAPKWIDSKKFDILAKTEGAPDQPIGGGYIDDDVRMMVRNLLIDRFQMKFHYEDRPVPAYTLLSSNPKLKKADPSHRAGCKEARVVANDPRDLNPRLADLMECRNITMAQFAKQLQGMEPGDIPNEVEDATGLSGAWDFTLSYSPRYLLSTPAPGQPAGVASDPGGGISLFDAISKQLGLKLEMRKRVMPVLVIDSMQDHPTDN